MGRETVLFKSEEKKTRSETANILCRLAEKIDHGHMSLSNEAGSVELEFSKNMTIEIKAKEETKHKTIQSFEIELEWIVGSDEQGSMVIG